MVKIGMVINDRYEIIEKIGTGGMSDVYKALDTKLNRNVAVKVLKAEFGENENFVSKFRVEAQAAAGLMHSNIVNVYDVGEENDIHYIVMELVEGITLKKYIEKKARLTYKEAVSIAIQVSLGIEAAHANHIIHRDIKPQNIIISRDGKVKVTDFGIAKAATSNTITSNVMGSVHYTSPEQARGGYSDEKSDIYSLGISMFEMLTGRVPFNGETTVAIAIKHIQEEMPSPREYVPEIPQCVESIIYKCCEKSPDRRYQNMQELIADLKQALLTPDVDFVVRGEHEMLGGTRIVSDEEVSRVKSGMTGKIEQPTEEERLMKLAPGAAPEPEYRENYREEYNSYDNSGYNDQTYSGDQGYSNDQGYGNNQGYGNEQVYESDPGYSDEGYDQNYDRNYDQGYDQSAAGGYDNSGYVDNSYTNERYSRKKRSRESYNEDNYDGGYSQEYEGNGLEGEEDYNPKMERITTIIAIGAGVVIIAIIVVLAITLFGRLSGNNNTKPQETEQTESPVKDDDEPETAKLVALPAMVGGNVDDVRNALFALGLKVSPEYEESETVEAGIIIDVTDATGKSLSEGQMVEEGLTVILKVSSGVAGVTLPDVKGYSVDSAENALKKEGFVVKRTEQHDDEIEEGIVISQSPVAGTTVPKGSTIELFVSIGPEVKSIRVPNLVGMTEEDAVVELIELGLKPGTVTQVNSETIAKDLICQQSVESGTYVDEGTAIDFAVSIGSSVVTYKYEANITAPTTEEAPDFTSGTLVHIVVTAADGKIVLDTTTTTFPYQGGTYYGLTSATGTITMTYDIVTEVEVDATDAEGNSIKKKETKTETKTITRSVQFVQE